MRHEPAPTPYREVAVDIAYKASVPAWRYALRGLLPAMWWCVATLLLWCVRFPVAAILVYPYVAGSWAMDVLANLGRTRSGVDPVPHQYVERVFGIEADGPAPIAAWGILGIVAEMFWVAGVL